MAGVRGVPRTRLHLEQLEPRLAPAVLLNPSQQHRRHLRGALQLDKRPRLWSVSDCQPGHSTSKRILVEDYLCV